MTTIAAAHAALPGPEREVLAFAYVSGLTTQQIGDLMGLEPAAVEELQALGLLTLADALWGTRLLRHVRDAGCRRAGCSACMAAAEAIEQAAAAYAGWEWDRPAPALRRAVLRAAAQTLDSAAPAREALVRR